MEGFPAQNRGFGPTLDMTPAGEILPRAGQIGWSARIFMAAAIIAALAAAAAAAAIFLWLATLLIPVALVAAAIAYAAFRLQAWQARAG